MSLLGDWFNLLALLALLRETSSNSGQVIGALFIFKLLPTFFIGPLAGVVADRYSRIRIMIWSDVVRVLITLSYLAVPFLPGGHLVAIYGLTALSTAASAFFEPARTATLPNILPTNALARANALGAITWSLIYAVGAGLGGLVNDWLGWRATILIDSLTFTISAVLVAGIRLKTRTHKRHRTDWRDATGLREVVAGIRYLKDRQTVLFNALLKTGWCLAGAIQLVLTLYGTHILNFGGRPDVGTAALFMARAFGTAVGPVVGRHITREDPNRMRRIIVFSYFFSAGAYLLFSVNQQPILGYVLVFLAHMGGSIIWVFSTVLLQWQVEDGFRGRVFATELGIATLTISLSTWLFGSLHDSGVPLRLLPVMLAGLLLIAGITFALWSRRLNARHQPPEH